MKEKNRTSTQRGHVPSQSSDQCSAVERAPPSLVVSFTYIYMYIYLHWKKKTTAKVTAVVTDKVSVLQHEHNFKTSHHLQRTGTGSLLFRHVGEIIKENLI